MQTWSILTLANCTAGRWAAGWSCCLWLHCARSSSGRRPRGSTPRPSPPPTAGGSWARWRRSWRRWRRRGWQLPRWRRWRLPMWTRAKTGTGRLGCRRHLWCCSPAPDQCQGIRKMSNVKASKKCQKHMESVENLVEVDVGGEIQSSTFASTWATLFHPLLELEKRWENVIWWF